MMYNSHSETKVCTLTPPTQLSIIVIKTYVFWPFVDFVDAISAEALGRDISQDLVHTQLDPAQQRRKKKHGGRRHVGVWGSWTLKSQSDSAKKKKYLHRQERYEVGRHRLTVTTEDYNFIQDLAGEKGIGLKLKEVVSMLITQ